MSSAHKSKPLNKRQQKLMECADAGRPITFPMADDCPDEKMSRGDRDYRRDVKDLLARGLLVRSSRDEHFYYSANGGEEKANRMRDGFREWAKSKGLTLPDKSNSRA